MCSVWKRTSAIRSSSCICNEIGMLKWTTVWICMIGKFLSQCFGCCWNRCFWLIQNHTQFSICVCCIINTRRIIWISEDGRIKFAKIILAMPCNWSHQQYGSTKVRIVWKFHSIPVIRYCIPSSLLMHTIATMDWVSVWFSCSDTNNWSLHTRQNRNNSQ